MAGSAADLLAAFADSLGDLESSVAAVDALALLPGPVVESALPPHPASANGAQIAIVSSKDLILMKHYR